MGYAIIGSGNVGKALATAFARKNLEVAIASRRSVELLEPIAKAIGPTIIPKALKDAVEADIIFLAIPFGTQKEVAKAARSWQGKIVIDVINAYGVSPEELEDLPSSVVVSHSFPGATLVKAFNHLPAEVLAQDPKVKDGRRVVFLSSDDESAADKVATLVERLGFAPVKLGKLTEGGLLVQARGKTWAQLIFQDFVKF
ncbi:NADPH-dependent F420 reductase [Granulicella tundricola]|uniref:NADP oxidoreductase coenzyme F420-dependent n=1 Tax=Granulicella tundricola (strain ATCC BAA-1859 / DSM 23138 / MP5ACTX9) TaxID=1198114 RepID=E8WWB9_GRATM|nr:NADPH-dependent F420 reductase [Granulicella tundricola]ADW68502.1 NADP oxidoreductase coenzyme F420-dependent [Granulicella tundricola MP5ACTX9]